MKNILTNIINKDFEHGINFKIGNFCIIESGVIVGDNVTIESFSFIQKGAKIGNNVTVGTYSKIGENVIIGNEVKMTSFVEIRDNCFIGDRCTFGSRCTLSAGTIVGTDVIVKYSFVATDTPVLHLKNEKLTCIMKNGSKYGANVVLMPGVTVGENSEIGACSQVRANVPDNQVWYGNPAKFYKKIKKKLRMKAEIDAMNLSREFKMKIIGNTDQPILYPRSLFNQDKNSISWLKNKKELNNVKSGYLIIHSEVPIKKANKNVTYLITTKKPRLIFAQLLQKYFNYENDVFANYVNEHRKNKKIKIGDFVFIGKNVEIGNGTLIHPNVVIHSNTKIGNNCVIKTHVSLGTEGIGIEMNEETNQYVRFPQLGGVILEDNVEIGPCSTVRRSALDNTIIMSGTKIGSLVNIGHNCIIGKNCMLTSQIVTAGSSIIGSNVVMGIGSSVGNGLSVGNNAIIGQGGVVVTNVPAKATYVGNPAIDINEYKKWSKVKKKLFKNR